MKKSLGLLIVAILFTTLSVNAQSHLQEMYAFNYSTHSNTVNVSKKMKDEGGNYSFTNVYTKYERSGSSIYEHERFMDFMLWYEQVFQRRIENDGDYTFVIAFDKKVDNLERLRLSRISGSKEKKVKNKEFEENYTDSTLTIRVDKGAVAKGDLIKVEIEKSTIDFRNVRTQGLAAAGKNYLAVSLPEFVRYTIDPNLFTIEETAEKRVVFKQLDTRNPIMTPEWQRDYPINSITQIMSYTSDGTEVKLPVITLDVPAKIGFEKTVLITE